MGARVSTASVSTTYGSETRTPHECMLKPCYDYNVTNMNHFLDCEYGGQMGTEAFSVRADSKKVKQLDRIAKQQDRSRNYLVNQAIDQLLELHAWQSMRVKEGIKAADEGRFASDSDMAQIFGKYENT